MKHLFSKTLGVAVMAGFTVPAMAAVINVGGVIWDTEDSADFISTSANIAQEFGDDGSGNTVLSGYGRIDFINFDPQETFCPGCELTFVYGDYTQVGEGQFAGGWVDVYVDNLQNFDIDDGSTAAEGNLWLSLEANGNLVVTQNDMGATGTGLLDAVGGLAQANFDTNTYSNGADVEFQNSFTLNSQYTRGSGNFGSDTTAVPEPATLGLLGLGLMGSALAGRRRRNAA